MQILKQSQHIYQHIFGILARRQILKNTELKESGYDLDSKCGGRIQCDRLLFLVLEKKNKSLSH